MAIYSLKNLCANLARRRDRRFWVEHGLQSVLGQPIEIFEAIDGSRISKVRLGRLPRSCSRSQYAIRLTQSLALRKFLQSEEEFLLYLEDDVAFGETFEERLVEAMQLDAEVVFLGGSHWKTPQPIPERPGWLRCVKTLDNHSLLFNREGARKVLRIVRSWASGAHDYDIALAMQEGRLQALCPSEMVAFQRSTRGNNFCCQGIGNSGSVSLAQGAHPKMLGDDLAVLDAALNQAKLVVEYGIGGSTVHIANRMQGWGRLVSVDHRKSQVEKVRMILDEGELEAELILCEPMPAVVLEESEEPERYLVGQLRDYVRAPHEVVEAGSVDLVFVDGRERVACALASADLLKKDGLLMIHDFWPNEPYRAFLSEILRDFEYLFESPSHPDLPEQGLAVFERR